MKLSPMFALLIVATAGTAFAQTTPPATDANQATPTTASDSTRDPNQPPASQALPPGTQMAQAAGQTPTEAAKKDPHNIQSSARRTGAWSRFADQGGCDAQQLAGAEFHQLRQGWRQQGYPSRIRQLCEEALIQWLPRRS